MFRTKDFSFVKAIQVHVIAIVVAIVYLVYTINYVTDYIIVYDYW